MPAVAVLLNSHTLYQQPDPLLLYHLTSIGQMFPPLSPDPLGPVFLLKRARTS